MEMTRRRRMRRKKRRKRVGEGGGIELGGFVIDEMERAGGERGETQKEDYDFFCSWCINCLCTFVCYLGLHFSLQFAVSMLMATYVTFLQLSLIKLAYYANQLCMCPADLKPY